MDPTAYRRLFALLILIFLMTFWLNSASAQPQHSPGCCHDRWDPAKSERRHWGGRRMGRGHRHRMQRHWTYMHQGIDPAYRGARNPLPATAESISAGRQVYQQHCAHCHGANGMGDGDVGKTLSPPPALLAYMVQRPMSVDGYLLWSISEGGKPFGTDMPSFAATLTREQIWTVILYMRAGFPGQDN